MVLEAIMLFVNKIMIRWLKSTTMILAIIPLILRAQTLLLNKTQIEAAMPHKASPKISDKQTPGIIKLSQLFDRNATDNFPITICSDSLSYNQQSRTIIYKGNVLVTQIKDIDIQCSKLKLTQTNNKIFIFNFEELKIYENYHMKQLVALKMIEKVCQRQKGCRFLSGQQLEIKFTEGNKEIIDILMTNEYTQDTVKFYTLPFSNQDSENLKSSNQKQSIYAEGEKIRFNFSKNLLTIENNAYIEYDGNQFLGEKVIYDNSNQLITIPNTGDRAIIVLHNNKQQH